MQTLYPSNPKSTQFLFFFFQRTQTLNVSYEKTGYFYGTKRRHLSHTQKDKKDVIYSLNLLLVSLIIKLAV